MHFRMYAVWSLSWWILFCGKRLPTWWYICIASSSWGSKQTKKILWQKIQQELEPKKEKMK